MIKASAATMDDVNEAIENARDIYGDKEELKRSVSNSFRHSYVVALRDACGNLGCVVGGIHLHRGVVTGFAVTTGHLLRHPVAYTRAMLQLVEGAAKALEAHRLEFTVRKDFEAGHRWAKALKFQSEGVLRQFGADKSDHVLYGRIF